jgi:antitoxin MazE
MTGIVQKWGNSLALRIPSAFAKDVHLRQGSLVEVAIVEGNMVIKPKKREKVSLAKLLKGVTKANLHAEQNYGGARGKEAW